MTKANSANPPALDFGEWLRSLNDSSLKEILTNRPDTTHPLPPGIGSLAARLKLRASIRRAIQHLNASDIAVLEVAAGRGGEIQPVTYPDLVADIADAIPDSVTRSSVHRLLNHALIFGSTDSFQIAPEVMVALPQQWSVWESSHYNSEELASLVADITEQQRQILQTLADSGGTGISKDAAVDADPSRPIPQLIARKLLHRVDATTVRLPAAVRAVVLGHTAPVIPLAPHKVAQHPPVEVEKLATANALEAVRLVRSFIEYAGHSPVPLLKDGAVGVRAQAAIKTALGCDEKTMLRVLAVALAARLVDRGIPENLEDAVLAPTVLAEDFLQAPLANQWALLVHGWWQRADFAPWLVSKSVRALADDSVVTQLPVSRRMVLSHYTTALDFAELSSMVNYYAPLMASTHNSSLLSELVDEASWLGVLVSDNSVWYPTAVLASLIAGDDLADLVAVTEARSPAPVTHLMWQGDMTLLAPGPLDHQLQSEISLLADMESAGLASSYRISETSLRRAFDAGRTAEDVLAFFDTSVVGDAPQTVSFLIQDIARKHGQLRGGPALSYIRCDDEALLLELSRSHAAHEVGLRLLAPTVAISQAPLAQVFAAVQEAGFHPVAENHEGLSIDIRQKPIRLETPGLPNVVSKGLTEEHLEASLAALKGDAAVASAPPAKTTLSPSTTLQTAIRLKQAIRVGFVDDSGSATTMEVTPIAVTGGQVSVIENLTGQLHRLSLHRLTEAVILNR
jgi:hypothetical protein